MATQDDIESQKLIADRRAVSDYRSQPVKNHPNRDCILTTFIVMLVLLTVLFFVGGFFIHRPVMGPLFIASVFPSFCIICCSYRKKDSTGERVCTASSEFDSDKVPVEILVVAFSAGVFITFIVALIGIGTNSLVRQVFNNTLPFWALLLFLWFDTFILTSLVEEGGKYFVGHFAVGDTLSQYIHHPYGVVLYCLAGALGFAALENVTYVLNEPTDAAWYLAIARALLSVPLHGTTGALIGVGLGRKHFLHDKGQTLFRVLLIPVIIHGLYDFIFVLPFRNGKFNRAESTSNLTTEKNTVDIGNWVAVFYLFNCALVLFGILYAMNQTDQLVEDYRIHREETEGDVRKPMGSHRTITVRSTGTSITPRTDGDQRASDKDLPD